MTELTTKSDIMFAIETANFIQAMVSYGPSGDAIFAPVSKAAARLACRDLPDHADDWETKRFGFQRNGTLYLGE